MYLSEFLKQCSPNRSVTSQSHEENCKEMQSTKGDSARELVACVRENVHPVEISMRVKWLPHKSYVSRHFKNVLVCFILLHPIVASIFPAEICSFLTSILYLSKILLHPILTKKIDFLKLVRCVLLWKFWNLTPPTNEKCRPLTILTKVSSTSPRREERKKNTAPQNPANQETKASNKQVNEQLPTEWLSTSKQSNQKLNEPN